MENKWLKYGMALVAGIPVALCLSVVCCGTSSLPADILEDDRQWMYGCGVLSLAGLALLVLLFSKRVKECLPVATSWVFILYGGMEAVWGIRQVYGFTYSNHSLYALTGSFYNPGPYSGYLAMIFPVCLYEWLKRKEGKKTIPYYIAVVVMLLILCVLPAGMSRSAWIAAAVSSIYVCGMHYRGELKNYIRQHRKKTMCFAVIAFLLGGMALGGIYQMKKDSADGRLFLWKIAARAVNEHPWTGSGWNSVPAAYGQAQENYFAAGNYTTTEELVAGAPEYVFNEYLQVAIAWGIPMLCSGLLILGGSMYIGHKQGIYGLCGALLSLAIFAFSSYPLQFPAFVSALVILVLTCAIHVLPLEKVWFRFMRAAHRLPGRIYPYYLLANLYAEPAFYQRDKLERMVQTVLEKEPKVQSTAIKQMRRKARELLKKHSEISSEASRRAQ